MNSSWVPRFLRENGVRKSLQELYVGMVGSTDNALLLLENEVDHIKEESATGNPLSASCFNSSVQWLRYLKQFVRSEQVFDQFLEPARSAARFIVKARETSPFATTFQGFVFRKSRPFYDRYFAGNIQTISIALPEIAAVMSMRCRREQAKSIMEGNCTISGVQPLPFVNRLHPTRMEVETLDRPTNLLDLHFCKTSFMDIDTFDRSIAFENLCEVWSEQIYNDAIGKHGRRLGAACLFGGYVVSGGSGPYISVRDPCDSHSVSKFYVAEQVLKALGKDLAGLRDLAGKLVRMLAVLWYEQGNTKSIPKYPEIVALEFANNLTELINDDLIGFVRLRGKVKQDLLKDRYSKTDTLSPPKPLLCDGESLLYDFSAKTKDRIGQIFLGQQNLIRSLRKTALEKSDDKETILTIQPELVLNMKQLELNGMAEWICDKKELLDSLLTLITRQDLEGCLPSKPKELIQTCRQASPAFSRDSLMWLRTLDLVRTKKDNPARVTERGIDIASVVLVGRVSKQLEEAISRVDILDLLGLEEKILAPPSILLKALRALEMKHCAGPVEIDGAKCELFWTASKHLENAVRNAAADRLRTLETGVVTVLNSVHYPLNSVSILARIRESGKYLNYLGVVMVLSRLKHDGKIEKNESGLWSYPLKTRIVDILSDDSSASHTIKEIAIEASLAPMSVHLLAIQTELKELERSQIVQEVLDGEWAIPLSEKDDERRYQILRYSCRRQVLEVLRESSGELKREKLFHRLTGFILKTKKAIKIDGSSYAIACQIINEMLAKDEISIRGDSIVLTSNKS